MEFHDDTTFEAGAETGADSFGADHDSGLGAADGSLTGDDHYSMIANDSTGADHSNYGDAAYGDSSSTDDSSSAGGESSATGGSTVSIEVDGHTYTEAATTDSEGYAEAHISLPDGDTVVAVDTDHDGQADGAAILGTDGKVIDVQHEDRSTGEWIDDGVPSGDGSDSSSTDPGDSSTDTTSTDTTSTDTTSGDDSSSTDSDSSSDSDSSTTTGPAADTAPGEISIDAGGQHFETAETIDVNQDGHADSGVVEADGKTYLLTDFDGDGHADHVEVGEDGQWKGGYSVSADGHLTPDPGTTPDESDIPSGSSYAVDPQTGEWVSNN